MSKQSILIIIGIAAAVVLIVIFASVRGPGGTIAPGGEEIAPAGPTTRESLPRNIVISVPGAGEQTEEGVAAPEYISPVSAHRGEAVRRDFTVKIENGMFEPRELRAFVGDTVKITATAVDGDYTVTQPDYGFGATILRGETKPVTHPAGFEAAAADKFAILCSSCNNPLNPIGFLVVVPRE